MRYFAFLAGLFTGFFMPISAFEKVLADERNAGPHQNRAFRPAIHR